VLLFVLAALFILFPPVFVLVFVGVKGRGNVSRDKVGKGVTELVLLLEVVEELAVSEWHVFLLLWVA